MIVPEKIKEFICDEVKRSGYELVEILARNRGGLFLEIVIEKKGGITAGECGEFNKRVRRWIEENSFLRDGYFLDVCSPGLDRELKSPASFSWAQGKRVRIRTYDEIDGKKEFTGKLVKAGDEKNILLEDTEGNSLCIDREKIAKAKLESDF